MDGWMGNFLHIWDPQNVYISKLRYLKEQKFLGRLGGGGATTSKYAPAPKLVLLCSCSHCCTWCVLCTATYTTVMQRLRRTRQCKVMRLRTRANRMTLQRTLITQRYQRNSVQRRNAQVMGKLKSNNKTHLTLQDPCYHNENCAMLLQILPIVCVYCVRRKRPLYNLYRHICKTA